jgi:hypothetical protein
MSSQASSPGSGELPSATRMTVPRNLRLAQEQPSREPGLLGIERDPRPRGARHGAARCLDPALWTRLQLLAGARPAAECCGHDPAWPRLRLPAAAPPLGPLARRPPMGYRRRDLGPAPEGTPRAGDRCLEGGPGSASASTGSVCDRVAPREREEGDGRRWGLPRTRARGGGSPDGCRAPGPGRSPVAHPRPPRDP